MGDYEYDLVVIGSGPAGQRASIQAAKLDKKVAVLERLSMLGRRGRQYGHRQQDHAGGSAAPHRISGTENIR